MSEFRYVDRSRAAKDEKDPGAVSVMLAATLLVLLLMLVAVSPAIVIAVWRALL